MDGQREHLPAGCFSLGQHVVVSQRLVERLLVDRVRIVDRRADALPLQVVLQRLPIARRPNRVLVEDVTPVGALDGNLHTLQPFAQVTGIGDAPFVPAGQLADLRQADSSLDVRGTKVVPQDIVPVALRLAVVVVLLVPGDGSDWTALFSWPGSLFARLAAMAIGLAVALTAAMLALGVAGRLAALGLLTVACVDILASGFKLGNGLVLAGTIGIMHFGSGALSIWRPEDTVLSRRAGEQTGSLYENRRQDR